MVCILTMRGNTVCCKLAMLLKYLMDIIKFPSALVLNQNIPKAVKTRSSHPIRAKDIKKADS